MPLIKLVQSRKGQSSFKLEVTRHYIIASQTEPV